MEPKLVLILENLLKNSFRENEYKKLTIEQAKDICSCEIGGFIERNKNSPDGLVASKLLTKIKKSKTVIDILMLISEKYFSLQGMDA